MGLFFLCALLDNRHTLGEIQEKKLSRMMNLWYNANQIPYLGYYIQGEGRGMGVGTVGFVRLPLHVTHNPKSFEMASKGLTNEDREKLQQNLENSTIAVSFNRITLDVSFINIFPNVLTLYFNTN